MSQETNRKTNAGCQKVLSLALLTLYFLLTILVVPAFSNPPEAASLEISQSAKAESLPKPNEVKQNDQSDNEPKTIDLSKTKNISEPKKESNEKGRGNTTDEINFVASITSVFSSLIGLIKSIIDATNKNEGSAIVFFTFILVLINKKLADETKLIREKDTEPKLEVYLIPSRTSTMIINMIVRNIGGGAARNIKWKIVADEKDLNSKDIPILKMSMFKVVHYLPANESIEFFFGETSKILTKPKLKPIKIKVSYDNDKAKNTQNEEFELNIEPYEGMITVGTPTDYEISKSLVSIKDDIHKITTGMSKLQILTQTIEEHRAEEEVKLEEARQMLKRHKNKTEQAATFRR